MGKKKPCDQRSTFIKTAFIIITDEIEPIVIHRFSDYGCHDREMMINSHTNNKNLQLTADGANSPLLCY